MIASLPACHPRLPRWNHDPASGDHTAAGWSSHACPSVRRRSPLSRIPSCGRRGSR